MGRFLLLSVLCLFTACGTLKTKVPQPSEEFRGVWVATVANIDWPRHPGDSWEQKQKDFLQILNFYNKMRFNAVLVQIRTAGDAFYPSRLAPWSRYLTGKEGDPGDIPTDPLRWMIEETHKRGMEFHAWFNPYSGRVWAAAGVWRGRSSTCRHPIPRPAPPIAPARYGTRRL